MQNAKARLHRLGFGRLRHEALETDWDVSIVPHRYKRDRYRLE